MESFVNILLILAAYLLGSIPFGFLLTKYLGLGDIRNIGSGNIGATNVMRTGNKKLAIATLILDGLKGAIIVIIARYADAPQWAVLLCAVSAILGHMFPVWLKFKGGKGVSTTIAVYLALSLPLGIFVSLAWVFVFQMSRISSFSSVSSIFLANVVALFYGGEYLFLATLFITIMVVYKHKENIIRLMRGEEKAFTMNKKD